MYTCEPMSSRWALSLVFPVVLGSARVRADEPVVVAPAVVAPPAAPPEAVRGPADDLVVEAGIGYAVGAFTAIQGRDPAVAHGPMFHLGLGWAWTLRPNQSVGIQGFVDGTLDGDGTTQSGTSMAGRYGGGVFVYGEKAHVRLNFGYAHATREGNGYSGIGVGFAVGWQVPLANRKGWKYPAFIAEIVPSWDFLGAGSETLHRWNFGIVIGLAVL